MYAIETSGITKHYKDVTAVDNLTLTVKEGELFALLGVNGAGKTTAIKILCGLITADSGVAFVKGHNISTGIAGIKRIIGVSPQETAIAPNLTVKENLQLICGLHSFSKDKSKKKIAELTESFKLSEILNKKAGKLSGGWQRRLSIAMALISEPEILFLDEPTLGLDVIARSELWDMVYISR